jgi:hypothetical protein
MIRQTLSLMGYHMLVGFSLCMCVLLAYHAADRWQYNIRSLYCWVFILWTTFFWTIEWWIWGTRFPPTIYALCLGLSRFPWTDMISIKVPIVVRHYVGCFWIIWLNIPHTAHVGLNTHFVFVLISAIYHFFPNVN